MEMFASSSVFSLSLWMVLLLLLTNECLVGVMCAFKSSRPSGSSGRERKQSTAVSLSLINVSGSRVALSWIGASDNVLIGDILSGTTMSVNSFVGHDFELRELPDLDTEECGSSEDQTCRMAFLKVVPGDVQDYSINSNFEVVRGDLLKVDEEIMESSDFVNYCKDQAKKTLEDAAGDSIKETKVLEGFNSCLAKGLAPKLLQAEEELNFQSGVREEVAVKMENFTCANPHLETSPDVRSYEWISERDSVSRTVHVKFDRPAARIHLVENFASPEECTAMEEAASAKLHRASTADGKGGSQFSESRKAMQASIRPKFELEEKGDQIARLSRRVYDYTNHVLNLNISEAGQEPLMSIQYAGRGENDTQPDRYTPHCDGDCVGKPHVTGSRMATMVIYCTIPESGGHTNFRNANVHIKPEVGSAIFFGYINPETKIMDTGFTMHSGCPVYEGEKKIITQWVRLGVNAETTSDHFNTLGILYSEAGDD